MYNLEELRAHWRGIRKKHAYTHLGIGGTGGWLTGYTAMTGGALPAVVLGASIVTLEVAYHYGIVSVVGAKLTDKIDQGTDRVEAAVTGKEKSWAEKAERYAGRKVDRADDAIRERGQATKDWYRKEITGDKSMHVTTFHLFAGAFLGGILLGVITAPS